MNYWAIQRRVSIKNRKVLLYWFPFLSNTYLNSLHVCIVPHYVSFHGIWRSCFVLEKQQVLLLMLDFVHLGHDTDILARIPIFLKEELMAGVFWHEKDLMSEWECNGSFKKFLKYICWNCIFQIIHNSAFWPFSGFHSSHKIFIVPMFLAG